MVFLQSLRRNDSCLVVFCLKKTDGNVRSFRFTWVEWLIEGYVVWIKDHVLHSMKPVGKETALKKDVSVPDIEDDEEGARQRNEWETFKEQTCSLESQGRLRIHVVWQFVFSAVYSLSFPLPTQTELPVYCFDPLSTPHIMNSVIMGGSKSLDGLSLSFNQWSRHNTRGFSFTLVIHENRSHVQNSTWIKVIEGLG